MESQQEEQKGKRRNPGHNGSHSSSRGLKKMSEEAHASGSISALQSTLDTLTVNENVQPSALRVSQHCRLTKDMNQSECEFNQEPGSLEWISAEDDHSEISVFQEPTPSLTVFSKWKSFLYSFTKEAGHDLQANKTPPVCGNMRVDPDSEEGTSQIESHCENQKGSAVQQHQGPLTPIPTESLPPTLVSGFIEDTTVSKENELKPKSRPAPPKPPRTKLKRQGRILNVDWKLIENVEEQLNKDNHLVDLDGGLFFETQVNPASKSTQSVSDVENSSMINGSVWPEKPDVSFRQSPEQEQESALEPMNCESARPTMQKKVKTVNMVTSLEETEPPLLWRKQSQTRTQPSLRPSLLPSPKEESAIYECTRTVTLQDFTWTPEPINLLEEVLIGEEWAHFLTAKDGPLQEEANNQSQMKKTLSLVDEVLTEDELASFLSVKDSSSQSDDNGNIQTENTCHLNNDMQSQNLIIKQDKKQSVRSESEKCEVGIDDGQLDRVSQEKHKQREKDSYIFAVPKTRVIHRAQNRKKPDMGKNVMADNIYDFVPVFLLSKCTLNRQNPSRFLLPAFKSVEVLDTPTLKSQIHLGQKRKHRLPKLRKKGKSAVMQTAPSLTDGSSASTSTQLTKAPWAPSVFASSVFYSLPHSSLPPKLEESLASAFGAKKVNRIKLF